MADQIMDDNAVFTVGQAAWHGKGVRLDIPPNTEEALRLARLDWQVSKEPVYAHVQPTGAAGGEAVQSTARPSVQLPTESYATVRFDETGRPHVLGVVGKRYEVLQNREAFSVFDRLLEDRGCTYESAGAIRDGRRVWILARIPESMQVADDVINRYFLLILSHDGSLPLVLKPTPIRVVCNNTLNLALRDRSNQFSVRHLRGMRDRLQEVTDAIVESELNFERAREQMERMATTRILDPTEYFFRVMPDLRRWNDETQQRNVWKKRYLRLIDLHHTGHGNHGRTLWDAYNAMVEWVDHDRECKEWVEATQFGAGDRIKRAAYETAVVMSESQPRPKITVPTMPWMN
jgi:phage/plasmid-like protein (TIGR03299 family)